MRVSAPRKGKEILDEAVAAQTRKQIIRKLRKAEEMLAAE
jgi:hypothetical protein